MTCHTEYEPLLRPGTPLPPIADMTAVDASPVGRHLTWSSVYILIISRVIGSGIFATPGTIVRSVGSPGLSMILWILGAVIAAFGLSVSLEFGTMLPRSGGDKVYLEYTYRWPRFLTSTLVGSYVVFLGFTAANTMVFSQERFRSLIPSYIRDSSVAVVVYDVTNQKSFQNTKKWIDDVRAERGNDVIIVLVGNKTDLSEKREVTTQQGEAEAKAHDLIFMETSAKAGHNVKTLFKRIAQALPGMDDASGQATSQMIDVNTNTAPAAQEGCAC